MFILAFLLHHFAQLLHVIAPYALITQAVAFTYLLITAKKWNKKELEQHDPK